MAKRQRSGRVSELHLRREIRELQHLLESCARTGPEREWTASVLHRCLARRRRWLEALQRQKEEAGRLTRADTSEP